MDNNAKLVPSTWRTAAIAAICACLALAVLFFSKNASTQQGAATEEDAAKTEGSGFTLVEGEDPLSLWTDDAPLKKELIEYVEAVTDDSSPDFIPVEDRVATFDIDGTLLN